MLNWFKTLFRKSEMPSVGAIFDQYELKKPAHQNAIDALPGWNSAFPPQFGLTAGKHHLYADGRIEWALQTFGPIEDKTVLEVGPLEGMHTYRLNLGRPARLDAIEANRLCFLRCLVTDQVLNIDRATFYLGDIQEWLKSDEIHYDLAIASGVLYHMSEPAEFLKSLSLRADAVFIWTHFFLDEAMPVGDVRRIPFSGKVETRIVEDVAVRHYERSYQHANTNASFCGGMADRHFWLHRDDILTLLAKLGYNEIVIKEEELDHSGGPCFSLFARRTAGPVPDAV
jgi:hypothetical protein